MATYGYTNQHPRHPFCPGPKETAVKRYSLKIERLLQSKWMAIFFSETSRFHLEDTILAAELKLIIVTFTPKPVLRI